MSSLQKIQGNHKIQVKENSIKFFLKKKTYILGREKECTQVGGGVDGKEENPKKAPPLAQSPKQGSIPGPEIMT